MPPLRSPPLPTSTPKPLPEPKRFHDQLSFLDDLLGKKEDDAVHEKLDILIENQKVVLENQKALFKLMGHFIKGGSVRTQERTNVREEISHGLGRIVSISVGRDRETTNFVSRDIVDNIGGSSECGGNLGGSSNVSGNLIGVGEEYRGNNIVSSVFGGNLPDLGDISNVLGESIISPGEQNRGKSLVDISNVIGRSNSLGEESRGSKNISREESLGEEGEKFMGEALLLKRSSCSVGNFAAKFLNVIFTPEELVNRNCTGTRGKGSLDAGKLGLIKKYVLKLYPCTPALEETVWRKCVVAIDEFLRRKKRDGRQE